MGIGTRERATRAVDDSKIPARYPFSSPALVNRIPFLASLIGLAVNMKRLPALQTGRSIKS